jgi:hypothetical protein
MTMTRTFAFIAAVLITAFLFRAITYPSQGTDGIAPSSQSISN